MKNLTIEQIVGYINDVSKQGLDESTAEYAAGMISEENIESASDVYNLISDFLLDEGAAKTESDAHEICAQLFKLLKDNSSVTETKDDTVAGDERINVKDLFQKKDTAYADPFLGIRQDVSGINYNAAVEAQDADKQEALIKRQQMREKSLRLLKEWEKNKPPLPKPTRRHGDMQLKRLGEGVVIDKFSLSVAGRELLRDTSLKLMKNRRYGLVGRNGIGKSTLLHAIARGEIIGFDPDFSVACVEQEYNFKDETVLQAVLSVDEERASLLEEENLLTTTGGASDKVGIRLSLIFERLQEINAADAESQAATILSGLGFSSESQNRKVSSFSGGWKMRVCLARALFADADILLLDEPTNHLDLEAVQWLTRYLTNGGKFNGKEMPKIGNSKIVMVVSHSRDFLNDVCTDVMHFSNQTLTYYNGNYDTFENVRAANLLQQNRQLQQQEMKQKHMKAFIDKFRYNAKRASLVQSRIKALSKLPMLDAISSDPALVFNFKEPEPLAPPFLQFVNVGFSYKLASEGSEKELVIVKDLDLNVDMDSRIAICGVNGSGKTTVLSLLVGDLEGNTGDIRRSGKLRIGYFTQQHVDKLDFTLNAVQSLQYRFPEANISDEAARSYLGSFGISNLLALEPLYILSGGQKSRVAIALMAYNNPHILVLDEPTNHLDLDAVQALITALNAFEGGVVVVSHDSHLLSCVADEIYYMCKATTSLKRFNGDFREYAKASLKGS